MSNSKLAVEYFASVEFDSIEDPTILQTIYNEIKVAYFTIINHKQLSYKLEELLAKSTHAQRINFLVAIDNKICQTKLGSRITEKIFELCESSFTDTDIETIMQKYNKDIVEMFAHQNATFVVRKLLSKRFLQLLDDNYENVIQQLKSIFSEDNALITLQQYLEVITKRQKLIRSIITNHYHIEDVKSKRSYLFQKIVTLANSKNLGRIYEKTKDDFVEICEDRYANYVMQELVKRDKKNILFYYKSAKRNIEIFRKNSNIVLNLCVALYESYPEKACNIVRSFYFDEEKDFIKGTLIQNGTIDSKFVCLVRTMLKADNKYNLNIGNSYLNNFTLTWLKQKCGRELFEEYLKVKKSDKKGLIVKVKEQMGRYTEERKMMQYLDKIIKKYN